MNGLSAINLQRSLGCLCLLRYAAISNLPTLKSILAGQDAIELAGHLQHAHSDQCHMEEPAGATRPSSQRALEEEASLDFKYKWLLDPPS